MGQVVPETGTVTFRSVCLFIVCIQVGWRRRRISSTAVVDKVILEKHRAWLLDELCRLMEEHGLVTDAQILNVDQTFAPYVCHSNYTWTEASSDKRQRGTGGTTAKKGCKEGVSVVVTVSLDGSKLPMQLIYRGKTRRSCPVWKSKYGDDSTAPVFAQNPSRWSTATTTIAYIEDVLVPYRARVIDEHDLEEDAKILIMLDNFTVCRLITLHVRAQGQRTPEVLEKFREKGFVTLFIPAGYTAFLQPLDLTVMAPIKEGLKERYHAWYNKSIAALDKKKKRANKKLARWLTGGVCFVSSHHFNRWCPF